MVYYYTEQTTLVPFKDVVYVTDLEEVAKELQKHTTICIDCETTGLDPLKDKIIMFQFGTDEDQYVIDTRGLDFAKYFKELLEDQSKVFVGHNIKFDYNMLKQYGIVLSYVYDTMLAENVIFNDMYSQFQIIQTRRFSLAGVYHNYTHKHVPKTVREEFQHWGASPYTAEHVEYGAKDVVYPLEIKEAQAYAIAKFELEKAVNLENRCVLAIGDIEYNGFYVDTGKWLDAYVHFKLKLAESLKELDTILIEKAPKYEIKAYQLDLFSALEKKRYTDVNWGSSSQVQKILEEEFGIIPTDKHGKVTTDTPTLKKLDNKPPIIKAILNNRKYSKVVTSFGKKFLDKHLHSDGRLRSHFNQIVGTGRMSSRNPNMQQIPSGKEFRGAFIAPPGKALITADYSNQEGRIMADKSGDEAYIDFFNGDVSKTFGDAHSFIAQTMFSAAAGHKVEVPPKPPQEETEDELKALEYYNNHPNKDLRQKGKTINFMISFGGSAFSLARDLKISEKEAQGLIDSFYKGFPGLKIMFDTAKKEALKTGMVRTNSVTNRLRWIPEWKRYNELRGLIRTEQDEERLKEMWSEAGTIKGRIERKGMNTGIQGTAGDMTKTALVIARQEIIKRGIRPLQGAEIKLVQVVHDEIVMESNEDVKETGGEILQYAMEKAGTYYCNKVNMTANPVIGSVWDH